MEITRKLTFEFTKIYFDGVLHLALKHKAVLTMQSWRDYSGTMFVIEFNFTGGHTFTLEYDKQEKWQKVLNLLEEPIFGREI